MMSDSQHASDFLAERFRPDDEVRKRKINRCQKYSEGNGGIAVLGDREDTSVYAINIPSEELRKVRSVHPRCESRKSALANKPVKFAPGDIPQTHSAGDLPRGNLPVAPPKGPDHKENHYKDENQQTHFAPSLSRICSRADMKPIMNP